MQEKPILTFPITAFCLILVSMVDWHPYTLFAFSSCVGKHDLGPSFHPAVQHDVSDIEPNMQPSPSNCNVKLDEIALKFKRTVKINW